jgi:two-component system, LytTR family, sensor histidine kinase AlgZ
MHPLFFRLSLFLGYIALWISAGFLFAYMLVKTQTVTWSSALLFALPALLLFGFIIPSSYHICRSLPFSERKLYRVVFIFLSSSLLSAILWFGVCVLWNGVIGPLDSSGVGIEISDQLRIFMLITSSLLYLISLLTHDAFIAFENFQESTRRQHALTVFARDAELQLLRNQINPHFLFNSLNSISALTTIDSAAARAMTIELGSFYRKTLAMADSGKITLSEELELCEHFLAIEKIRFGDKLNIQKEIEPLSLTAKLPSMLLQPLFENAIKHGICHLREGGVITLRSYIEQSWLYISISNSIGSNESGMSETKIGTGTGLKNLKARIENNYQENSRTSWHKYKNSFTVEIIIPAEW